MQSASGRNIGSLSRTNARSPAATSPITFERRQGAHADILCDQRFDHLDIVGRCGDVHRLYPQQDAQSELAMVGPELANYATKSNVGGGPQDSDRIVGIPRQERRKLLQERATDPALVKSITWVVAPKRSARHRRARSTLQENDAGKDSARQPGSTDRGCATAISAVPTCLVPPRPTSLRGPASYAWPPDGLARRPGCDAGKSNGIMSSNPHPTSVISIRRGLPSRWASGMATSGNRIIAP